MPVKAVVMPTGEEPLEETKEPLEAPVPEEAKKPRGKAKSKAAPKAKRAPKPKEPEEPKEEPKPEEPKPEEPKPEEPEEPEEPFEVVAPKKKAKAKRATRADVDLQAKTVCPICNKVLSNHALMYTHRCSKCDTEEEKYPKRLEEEAPPPPPLVRQQQYPTPQYVQPDPYRYQAPQLSYKDILLMHQQEMRQARHARQVAPLRSHYGM